LPLQTLRADIDFGMARRQYHLRRDWRQVLVIRAKTFQARFEVQKERETVAALA